MGQRTGQGLGRRDLPSVFCYCCMVSGASLHLSSAPVKRGVSHCPLARSCLGTKIAQLSVSGWSLLSWSHRDSHLPGSAPSRSLASCSHCPQPPCMLFKEFTSKTVSAYPGISPTSCSTPLFLQQVQVLPSRPGTTSLMLQSPASHDSTLIILPPTRHGH